MTRDKLPDRRPGITVRVAWTSAGGPDHSILVSYGYDQVTKRIKEAFVAGIRIESGINALANDGCIMYSRCLQHGDGLEELAAACVENRSEGDDTGPPASMLGAIARIAVEVQKQLNEVKADDRPDDHSVATPVAVEVDTLVATTPRPAKKRKVGARRKANRKRARGG